MTMIIAAGVPSCGLTQAKSPLAGQNHLPAFPDPMPPPATSLKLPAGLVAEVGSEALADAHLRLAGALEMAGFDKWSVYAFKDGFALVTRWERIKEDGRPTKDRFPTRHPKRILPGFDFDEHVRLLFNAPDGDYRLFVFTVAGTDAARTTEVLIDGDNVEAGQLPDEVAGQSSANRIAEAHVYLFQQQGDGEAEALTSSPLDAATHLTQAGIFKATQLDAQGEP